MSRTPYRISTEAIVETLRRPHKAVMLFGSIARGTSTNGSDVDVLQVVPEPRPSYKEGALNVSVYCDSALTQMALEGSLFVLHLKLEGKILYDPEGLLQNCLTSYRQREDYSSFLADLAFLTGFLDVSSSAYAHRAAAVNRMAVFILRSALFAILAQKGRPCFEMRDVANSFQDASILHAYSLKHLTNPDAALLDEAKLLLEKYLRCRIRNRFGSYEALLLNCSRRSEFVRSVALHFLKRFSGEEEYGLFKHRING
jgi:hypothetical protein